MTANKRAQAGGSNGSYGPLTVGAIGVMITAVTFIALIVAGVAAADLFPVTSAPADALRDRGVWSATQAWANPLGIVGLAVLFAGAVPYALINIGNTITYRRDVMSEALPVILSKGGPS